MTCPAVLLLFPTGRDRADPPFQAAPMKEVIIKLIEILVHAAFPAVVFTICSGITLRDLLGEIRHPSRLIRISLVSLLAVPVATAVTFKFIGADMVVTGIALVAAMAPGDSFALLEAESKKARITLAAATMAWLCILMPFTVPVWLALASQVFPLRLEVSPREIFTMVAPLTILPLVLGVFFREVFPSLSNVLKKITGSFFRFAIVVVALASLLYAPQGLAHYTAGSVVAICVAVTAAIFMGYYCGLPERKDRLTSALTASLGNFAVVILVAHLSYPRAHIVAVAVVFIMIRWLVIMFWYLILRHFLIARGETP